MLISLTAKGRDAVESALVAHMENERALLAGLTRTEQGQLADPLRQLQLSLGGR